MHIRDITTTTPADGIITVRTESGLIELEVDDRDEMVRIQLNQHKAAVLMAALSQALAMVAREKAVTDGH